MKKFVVSTKNPCNIIIGRDILKDSGQLIADEFKPCRVCLITDSTVNKIYAQVVFTSLMEAGFQTSKIVFPAGEHSKNLNTYSNIMEALAEEGITRSDLIIALGGGVVGDMVGFIASTYMRGISYIQIPTTFLAAIDSSVGGKTAINLLSGKNLAGSFWQPSMVLSDYKTFDSLPDEKLLDGVAEAVKNAAVAESSLVNHIINRNYEYVIERCVSIKKSIVEADEFDRGMRQILNFGHTIGHGIEKLSLYSISHGHAIAQGMIVEALAAYRHGLTTADISPKLLEILSLQGFSLGVPYSVDDIYQFALMDKKIDGDRITLIVPDSFGKCHLQKLPLSQLKSYIALGLNK